MANKKIIIGPLNAPILEFDNVTIESVVEEAAVALLGDELAVDVLEPVVEYKVYIDYDLISSDGYRLISSDGYVLRPYSNYDLEKLPYGTKLTYFIDNRVHGEFFVKDVDHQTEKQFQINAQSAIGKMSSQTHVGGMYDDLFGVVLADVLGDEYEYTMTDEVAELHVRGYLPYGTRRSNLQQLITAYGVTILRSDMGGMLFTKLGDTTPVEIPEDRLYTGGKVKTGEIASRVEVTEHAYFYMDNVAEETVYDNTKSDMVTNAPVKFSKPIYPDSLRCSEGSLVISERGVNYAIVSGTGILVGKPYTHTTRILAKDNPNATTEKVVPLSKATLVTVANSDNVLLRLAEYHFNARRVKSGVVLADEKPGRRYRLLDGFRRQTTGFLVKMSNTASGITKADCEFIANYVPKAVGNAYSSLEVLRTASGIWNIPDKVFEKEIPYIRVVLIGPGETGQRGSNGEAGERSTDTRVGKGGKGGAGGEGGKGGKIVSLTIDCTGLTNFAFTISRSGVRFMGGGFDLNSVNGASSPTGFLDVFTGTVYALPGRAGEPGADGGKGGKYTHSTAGSYAEAGKDLTYNGRAYKGGSPGSRALLKGANIGISASMEIYAGRGGGSGAAVGANGNKAPDGSRYTHSYGADGVQPVKADPASDIPGSGGNGGHGGSGGGGGGISEWYNSDYNSVISTDPYAGGAAGPGGLPSEGADGAILIYF